MSGKCAVQSCLTGWSVNDEGSGCIKEQNPANTPAASGKSTTFGSQIPRDLTYQSQQNGSHAPHVKLHPDLAWRVPDTHSGRKHENKRVKTKKDNANDIPLEHINADWTRIPDYRRYLAA